MYSVGLGMNRRENGFHIGAFALYGYQKDPEQKGHLIVDEEAAVSTSSNSRVKRD